MHQLRRTIRKILLESNASYFPKLMKLLNGSQEDVAQGLSLAEGLGIIDKYRQDKEVDTYPPTIYSRGYDIVHHVHNFECVDRAFWRYIRSNKNNRIQDPNKWWQFNAYPRHTINIKIREDK